MDIFQTLQRSFEEPALRFMEQAANGLSSALGRPMTAALTLYVLWFGVLILKGSIQEPMAEMITRIIKAGIVTTLALNAGEYTTFVSHLFFQDLPREITAAIAGGPAPSASAFDAILKRTNVLCETIIREAGWSFGIIKAALQVGLIYVVMGGLMAWAFFMFMFAKLALALVLGLGPLFIAAALFEPTRPYTQGFLGQIVNYVILQVLTVAVLAMMLAVFDQLLAAKAPGGDTGTVTLSIVAGGVFCFGIISQLPNIAGALAAGGAWLQTRSPAATARSAHAATVGNADAAVGGIRSGTDRARSAARWELPFGTPWQRGGHPASHTSSADQQRQDQQKGKPS